MPRGVEYYKNQNYWKLKRSCLRSRTLYEDPLFPINNESLFFKRSPPGTIEWKRPKDVCSDPRLFVDGISSRDLHQGSLGNCWLVAAASCLATERTVWRKVIPNHDEQEWNPKRPDRYAGIFHFRFWRFGRWVDVVIDDRLPTMNGHLIFCHSIDLNEFWCALLEKAYAKLNGCYEALEGGNTAEALVDFTGGISEPICLDKENFSEDLEKRKKLYQSLLKAHSRGSLISSSIQTESGEKLESQMDCGLVKGHAYGVTDIRKVRLGTGLLSYFKTNKLFMIRMRNPWGSTEWTGPWSDKSDEWKNVSRGEREKMGVTVQDDGEFWMDFKDFSQYFTDMVVCRRINTTLLSFHKTWVEAMLFSQWSSSDVPLQNRSGGCLNNRETFFQNPQFMFDIFSEEDAALLSIQQEDKRLYRKEGTGDNLSIGFEVFRVEVNREFRMHRIQEKVAGTDYIGSRSIFLRVDLKQGKYVIIPTTFTPGQTGRFLIRLFTDRSARFRELKLDQPKPSFWSCCVGYPKRVTAVTVHRVTGLIFRGANKDPDVFVTIKCEGHKVKSKLFKMSSDPEFNLKAIFYRKKIQKLIQIEVWAEGFLINTFIGQVMVEATEDEMNQGQVLSLQDKSKAGVGSILIETSSSQDLAAL
ncbi:calpain-5-like isoform X1 [Latimeria chalumnae]|nr:PREDICTED: calpain-5-like isoform X1 [Latimeria chalumnae]|eukprot:XP_006008487.1 PREDICTED: calpain-5-like isoform X1 [Latimeria chalumnae]